MDGNKIHRLKPKKKEDHRLKTQTSLMNNMEQSQVHELLNSISSKLKVRSISLSTESRVSSVYFEREQALVSCIDGFTLSYFSHETNISLNFQQLKRIIMRRGLKKITKSGCHHLTNKRICFSSVCQIKQIWIKKIMPSEEELAKAEELKKVSSLANNKHWEQIEKDLHRSLPENLLPKTKITLFHVNSQKNNIYEGLRSVLRMYALDDEELGYVQGMNIVAAIIVSHVKEIQLSYLMFRQIMIHSGLRKLFLNNFKVVREECNRLLNHYVKELMRDLYDHLDGTIAPQMFMSYYLSLFGCCVDYDAMHNVIDLFMTKGIPFLHRLMISLLCFLKDKLMQEEPEEAVCMLGVSFMKDHQVQWDQVINLTQAIQLS